MKVLVTGGTGYVGREVVTGLAGAGHDVRVLARDASAARVPAGAEATAGDVTDAAALTTAAAGADAVVHLVAILDGSDAAFERINVGGTANAVAAAEANGIRRFLLMSAAGVNQEHASLTRYWATKWRAKQLVVESALDWTVFEPSFVFGKNGGALKTFESLLRLPVVAVVGDGRYRHQPVWVGDVAAAFAAALERPATIGKRYELGGPEAFTFDDLLDELARVTGRSPRPKVHVPAALMKAQAAVLRFFPPPLKVTREQIVMLLEGTECDITGMRDELGIEPASLADAYDR